MDTWMHGYVGSRMNGYLDGWGDGCMIDGCVARWS